MSNNKANNNNYGQLADEQAQASYDYPKLNDMEMKKPIAPPLPPPPPQQYPISQSGAGNAYQYPSPYPATQNVPQQQVIYVQQPVYLDPHPPRYDQQQHGRHDDNTYEELSIGNRHSVDLVCPSCSRVVSTEVKHKIGLGTNFCGLVLLLVGGGFCLCFLPYLIPSCKDAVHYCPSCSARIGTSPFLC